MTFLIYIKAKTMPQFDFYSFSYQVSLFLTLFCFFYFFFLRFFLINTGQIIKFRSKLENIKLQFINETSIKKDFYKKIIKK